MAIIVCKIFTFFAKKNLAILGIPKIGHFLYMQTLNRSYLLQSLLLNTFHICTLEKKLYARFQLFLGSLFFL